MNKKPKSKNRERSACLNREVSNVIAYGYPWGIQPYPRTRGHLCNWQIGQSEAAVGRQFCMSESELISSFGSSPNAHCSSLVIGSNKICLRSVARVTLVFPFLFYGKQFLWCNCIYPHTSDLKFLFFILTILFLLYSKWSTCPFGAKLQINTRLTPFLLV
jgi:hypothetical protein